MYPDREKALAKGRRKDKTFIRVFCGIFILLGIILFTAGIAVGVSSHTFRQKAEPVNAVILAMRGATSESLGTPVVEYAGILVHAPGQADNRILSEKQSPGSALSGR